jgi:hypothetical protein
MTTRVPLVIGSDGLSQQLQSGDSIAVTVTQQTVRVVTNGETATAIVIGMAVYASAADTVKRGQANAKATSQIIGLGYDASTAAAGVGNIILGGILVATTTQWDAVASTTGGLAFGAIYFADPTTPGKLTSAPPTTVGQCITMVGRALSTTEMSVEINTPILL